MHWNVLENYLNKPAAQAEGTDPYQWSSTNRQNHFIQQYRCNFWNNAEIFKPFEI